MRPAQAYVYQNRPGAWSRSIFATAAFTSSSEPVSTGVTNSGANIRRA